MTVFPTEKWSFFLLFFATKFRLLFKVRHVVGPRLRVLEVLGTGGVASSIVAPNQRPPPSAICGGPLKPVRRQAAEPQLVFVALRAEKASMRRSAPAPRLFQPLVDRGILGSRKGSVKTAFVLCYLCTLKKLEKNASVDCKRRFLSTCEWKLSIKVYIKAKNCLKTWKTARRSLTEYIPSIQALWAFWRKRFWYFDEKSGFVFRKLKPFSFSIVLGGGAFVTC